MFFEFNYKSQALKTEVQVNIIIPQQDLDKKYKVLWLLHGRGGNHSVWERYSSIERYSKENNIAVIMPNVFGSWYSDTAYEANYFTFLTEELPNICFKTFKQLSDKREDNFVGGLSMGGYGAIKIAFTYPERFGACFTLSGALDITRKTRPYNLNEWKAIFGFDLNSALELKNTKHDVFYLATQLVKENKPLPKIFIWCGEQDSLLDTNNQFSNLLTSLNIEHIYKTSEGDHSWKWWDMHVENAIKFILNNKED